jgi:hypothetical protein
MNFNPSQAPAPDPDPAVWTKKRLEIKAWLDRNAASLAELYTAAILIAHNITFPGRVRLLAHAVREIANGLPDAIAGKTKRKSVQYKNRIKEIRDSCLIHQVPLDFGQPSIDSTKSPDTPSEPKGLELPASVAKLFCALIRDDSGITETRRNNAQRFFEKFSSGNPNATRQLSPVIQQWLDVTDWFVGKSHDGGMKDSETPSGVLNERFALFEDTLAALIRGFFSTISELDEILEDTNS